MIEAAGYQVFKPLPPWKNPVSSDLNFTHCTLQVFLQKTNFSPKVCSPTLEFSAPTVELPSLLSQVSTHANGMGGRFKPAWNAGKQWSGDNQAGDVGYRFQLLSSSLRCPQWATQGQSGYATIGPLWTGSWLTLLHNGIGIFCSPSTSDGTTLINCLWSPDPLPGSLHTQQRVANNVILTLPVQLRSYW